MQTVDPEEARRRIAKLKKMWPRPRVSERLRLRNGKVGEVITVRMARDIFRGLTEAQALVMKGPLAATFGEHWPEVYYEADIFISGKLVTVNTREVEEILPPL